MIAPQTYSSYPTFGTSATKCQPVQVKYETGYIPGDVLPAEHLNWFLAGATSNITLASAGIVNLQQEMQTILCCAGQAPSSCLTCVDQVYNAMMYQINASAAQRAPTAHASSATTYGVGTADSYGHLKISDTYTEVLSACSGVAASQKALACVYATAGGKAGVGNTAGCPLGTASAGVATTAARSDHVHPMPTCVSCAGYATTAGNADTIDNMHAADFFYNRWDAIDSDVFTAAMNTQGAHTDCTHFVGWTGSLYTFYAGGSQSSLMFRVIGGGIGPDHVQMNYGVDSNRFGMDWATIINSCNIGDQSVSHATTAGTACASICAYRLLIKECAWRACYEDATSGYVYCLFNNSDCPLLAFYKPAGGGDVWCTTYIPPRSGTPNSIHACKGGVATYGPGITL